MIEKKPVKVIICGSRSFHDYAFLEKTVREEFKRLTDLGVLNGSPEKDDELIEIISGHAEGADQLGEIFAEEYSLWYKVMPADWDKYGYTAGFVRNCQMVDYVCESDCYGLVIAFWDGISEGTKHCFNYAMNNNLDVRIYKTKGELHYGT